MTEELAKTLAAVESRLRAADVKRPREEAARILARATEGGDAKRALQLADQRAAGTPLAYVLGRVRFMGIELAAAPGALVPREETELLGLRALETLATLSTDGRGLKVIDMCCGAGNLACALASSLDRLEVLASDLTHECVALTRRNVAQLGLSARVTVAQDDLFKACENRGLEGAVHAVVCNPPYISTGRLEKENVALLRHEPREAFDGGPYGLSVQQRVIHDAARFLKPSGWLLMEMGTGQERQLNALLNRSRRYGEVEWVSDAAGAPRVVLAQLRRE